MKRTSIPFERQEFADRLLDAGTALVDGSGEANQCVLFSGLVRHHENNARNKGDVAPGLTRMACNTKPGFGAEDEQSSEKRNMPDRSSPSELRANFSKSITDDIAAFLNLGLPTDNSEKVSDSMN